MYHFVVFITVLWELHLENIENVSGDPIRCSSVLVGRAHREVTW